MKGYYFTNTDIRHPRAHTTQILQTVSAIDARLSLTLVAPRYGATDVRSVEAEHGVERPLTVTLLSVFGIRGPGLLSFVLFNIPAMFYLLAKRFGGDVSFVYVRATHFAPLVLFARLIGVPCFFETHRRPITVGERVRDGLVARLSEGHIIVSDEVRRHFARYGKPTLVAHDGVALGRFASALSKSAARAMLGVPLGNPIVAYAGSISKLKGLDALYAAARLLPHVRFLCAGRNVGDAGKPPPNVVLLGQKPQGELPALLRAAEVLLIPHPRGDYSQSPMKLFEYMAAGVPIVASRLPQHEEVLNENNAVLVEPESPRALAEGIQKVLEDAALGARLAAQAALDVREYTWEARGRAIAAFVQNHVD